MSNRAHRRRRTQRPTRAELDTLARLSSLALGCTCTDIWIRSQPRHAGADVSHDPGCPASHGGTVLALYTRGHLRRRGGPDATP